MINRITGRKDHRVVSPRKAYCAPERVMDTNNTWSGITVNLEDEWGMTDFTTEALGKKGKKKMGGCCQKKNGKPLVSTGWGRIGS